MKSTAFSLVIMILLPQSLQAGKWSQLLEQEDREGAIEYVQRKLQSLSSNDSGSQGEMGNDCDRLRQRLWMRRLCLLNGSIDFSLIEQDSTIQKMRTLLKPPANFEGLRRFDESDDLIEEAERIIEEATYRTCLEEELSLDEESVGGDDPFATLMPLEQTPS